MPALAATDPLVAPTWWLAIATITLAVGAIGTAVLALMAFRKQAAEVTLLQQQAKDDQDDRRREAEEKRRERAAMVYMTSGFLIGPQVYGGGARSAMASTRIYNTGRQPVYDARVHWVDRGTGAQSGAESLIGSIAPVDGCGPAERQLPAGTEKSPLIPVAYFRDAAGIRWTLLDNGQLDEVDPAHPAGAPLIATEAVARARRRAKDASRHKAALADVGKILAEAANSHPFGTRRFGFWRTPRVPGKQGSDQVK